MAPRVPLKNATFVMDRGYDDNKIFQKLWGLEQDFVIRLTQKQKLFFHRKWASATKLCVERKGRELVRDMAACYYSPKLKLFILLYTVQILRLIS